MGAIFSQELLIGGSKLSGETKDSFEQIVQAIDRELAFKQRHTRSQSLEHRHFWQCKFCQTKNEADLLICCECGANKVNVYIPLRMDRQSVRYVRRRSVFVSHKREADEGVVLKHIEQIRRTNLDHNGRFKDQTFPASNQSIFINGHSFSRNTVALLPDQQTNLTSINDQIQWLRPDQIVPSDWSENSRASWTIFRDPKPNDVVQGALGDCWFITALSVLAEEPKYLKRVTELFLRAKTKKRFRSGCHNSAI